ncbi:30S ribosomal protein S5 [Candidatus Falkowbacteria bacterium]|nr:30S ribosomal protein S5 [Candidatus Falkowbacteria bacterium]
MANNRQTKRSGRREEGKSSEKEFDQVIVDIARVTRVMAGGKRMRFRACVVIGDRNGRVGSAVAKGADVTLAVNKAVSKARKDIVYVPIINETIPHRVDVKFGAAKILLKPAPKGTGIIAGGAVRIVLAMAGVSNVVAKILGTNNKINNVKATIKALKILKRIEPKAGKDFNNKIADPKNLIT